MQIKWQKSLFLVHFFAYLQHLANVNSGKLLPMVGIFFEILFLGVECKGEKKQARVSRACLR